MAASSHRPQRRAGRPSSSRKGLVAIALALLVVAAGTITWELSDKPATTPSAPPSPGLPVIESLAWAPSSLEVNTTTTGLVVVSGGSAPYSYAWSGLPNPCSSNDSADLACRPQQVGTFNVTVLVTDPAGNASETSSITVLPSTGVPAPQPPPGVPVALRGGGVIDTAGASFFGVVAQTSCYNCIAGGDGVYLNETPFSDVRYGQGGDSCDVVNNSFYENGQVVGPCPFSIPALKQWCYSTTPHCDWYVGLPGEIDSPSYAGYEANWLVHTLGFPPTYWSIGNEPESYTHWDCSWTEWSTCTGTPTPAEWASEVLAYARAIRAVVPSAKIIGIQAVGSYSPFIPTLAASAAAQYLYAIAFHDYPPPTEGGEANYLSLLQSQYSATTEIDHVRAEVAVANASIANIPIFIGEFNGGPCPVPSPMDQEFPDVLLYMGTVVQSLRANLAELDYFALANDGFSLVGPDDQPYPTGVWMEEMKSVRFGDAINLTVSGNVSNVWSVEWVDGSNETLMIVNANQSQQLSLSVGSSFALDVPGHTIFWNGTGDQPTITSLSLGPYYAIPPESILLVENY